MAWLLALLLLLPLLQVVVWLCEGEYGRYHSIFIPPLFVLATGLGIRQRMQPISEVYLLWFPLFIALLYLWARSRHSHDHTMASELWPFPLSIPPINIDNFYTNDSQHCLEQ